MLAAISPQFLSLVGIYVVCLVLSIAVHEYCHALAASKLGDPTPEQEGRLTLNPVSHADVVGTLILPVVAALGQWPLFGWGKPVPTQPRFYTRRVSMRGGMAIVAAAGPAGNVVLAGVVLGLAALLGTVDQLTPQTARVLQTLLHLNVVLCVLNLLPLHPLDGGKILAAFLPASLEYVDNFLLRYGGFIFIGLFLLGGRVLGALFAPFLRFADQLWWAVVG